MGWHPEAGPLPLAFDLSDGPDGLRAALDGAIDRRTRRAGVFRAGRVYCFQCADNGCKHAAPGSPAEVFAGYSPTGKPTWAAFTGLCIEWGAPVEGLYRTPPEPVVLEMTEHDLSAELLPAFGRGDRGFRVLGQAAVGLLPPEVLALPPASERRALSLQVVESGDGSGVSMGLNLVGATRDELLDAADSGGAAERLFGALSSARRRLDQAVRREPDRPAVAAAAVLPRLRADLERALRPEKRRTRHAQQRRSEGDRPTGNAFADAARAPDDRLLHDTRHSTVVVIGKKGRAHVFSSAGRHVTSMTLSPGEVARKTARGRWRPLSGGEARAFREALGG